jgi:hypothetical protein
VSRLGRIEPKLASLGHIQPIPICLVEDVRGPRIRQAQSVVLENAKVWKLRIKKEAKILSPYGSNIGYGKMTGPFCI